MGEMMLCQAALSAAPNTCGIHTQYGKSFCNVSGRMPVAVIIPPMLAVTRGLVVMDKMANDHFGFDLLHDCFVEPLFHCVPPNRKVPAKLCQLCTRKRDLHFVCFSFLVGPVVQKMLVGSAPNPKVSGGCGVEYKNKKYILLPDPFLISEVEDEGEQKDILRLYLNSIKKAERHVREWIK